MSSKTVNLQKTVGGGYKDFWNSRKRYRVLKGGRASKKSKTSALWFIYNLIKHPEANVVVVRKTYNTHKDSTFADLKWAAKQLQVYDLFKFITQPLEITYKPTGQKILFRGFDDVMKLTSISVDTGYLCWAWLEEAYELESEADFRTFDECIRGDMPDGLWKQITITYNPWINTHWTKDRFFDKEDPDADTFTTTYRDNEWLDEADRKLIEDLKETDPERYLVVGLGEYGIPGGAYFNEFRKDTHTIQPILIPKHWDRYLAIDYGLDMLAALWIAIDEKENLYIYKELYKNNLIVSEAAHEIKQMMSAEEKEITGYAPPDLWNRRNDTGRSAINIFNEHGLFFIKSDNNRANGWYSIKELLKVRKVRHEQTGEYRNEPKLKIFRNCTNLIRTLPQLTIDKKNPNDVSKEPHELTHAPDALRYFTIMRHSASYKDESEYELPPEIEEMYLRQGGTSFYG